MIAYVYLICGFGIELVLLFMVAQPWTWKCWPSVWTFICECWEDKGMGVAVYLAFCGGVVNIWVACYAIYWLWNHVRVV
jgi:hypothetical protein